MTPRQIKRALRAEFRERILALGPSERSRQEEAVRAVLPTLPGYSRAKVVLLYASAFPEEIDTGPMIRLALEEGRRVLCPRVSRERQGLVLFEIQDPQGDFEPGVLDIPEPAAHCPERSPSEVDWVLVPGLAFDFQGFRLGRGAGFYDRLLPTLPKSSPRWALALDPQWIDRLPVEPHDQPLNGVASPGRRLEFPNAPI